LTFIRFVGLQVLWWFLNLLSNQAWVATYLIMHAAQVWLSLTEDSRITDSVLQK